MGGVDKLEGVIHKIVDGPSNTNRYAANRGV